MVKTIFLLIAVALAVASAAPQQQGRRLFDPEPSTTPKPIVQIKRLINQQDRDGSYTYGFEADDGTFKIETRDKLGNVKGKYGYYDVNNELKVVDYTAGNGTGFDAQADFLPKPQQPLPVPAPQQQQPAPARSAPRPQASRPAPQPAQPQEVFRGAPEAPRSQPAPASPSGDRSGLSHFSDPSGVFQFSFPSPGQPASRAPAGSFASDGQYIRSIALEGFSEDADKDGFVDPVPQDGNLPPRQQRPQQAPAAAPQFASVDFGSPQSAPQQSFQSRPQFPQQEAPRFLPPPQQQPQQIPQRFAQFGADPFSQQQQQQQQQGFPAGAFQGAPQQQPQFAPQFLPQQGPSGRFLQQGQPGGVPVFQGATEPPRFVNPLQLQQARRPF